MLLLDLPGCSNRLKAVDYLIHVQAFFLFVHSFNFLISKEMRKRRGSSVSRSRTQSVDTHTSMQPVPENEVMKRFEAILKKRFESDDVFEKDEKSAAVEGSDSPRDEKDSAISDSRERLLNEGTSFESVSSPKENKSRVEKAQVVSTPRQQSSVSDDSVKPQTNDIVKPRSDGSVKLRSPQTSVKLHSQQDIEEDAFAALLKRRKVIEGSESDLERTESSASELSAFTTLPRTKAKPPLRSLSKEKKVAPPPLKPKPKSPGAGLKSATLPRSMSTVNESKNSEGSRSVLALKATTSLPVGGSEMTQKSTEISTPVGKLPNASTKPSVVKIQSRFDEASRNDVEKLDKIKDLSLKDEPTVEVRDLHGKKEEIGVKESPSNVQKSNEIFVNVGMRLPSYKVEVHFTDRGKSNDDVSREGRLRSVSIDAPKKPSRSINEKVTIKPYEPEASYDHSDNDYDNLPSSSFEANNESKALVQAISLRESGFMQKNYDHESDDYDNLPSDKFTPDDTVKGERVIEAVYDEADYAVPDFAVDRRIETESVGDSRVRDAEVIDAHDYLSVNREPSNGVGVKTSSALGKPTRKLARSLSLSSSQSSDGDSPKSYRKFKQNRSATSKPKSSPFQKIKGVIDGMRSRSSSDASTTSYDPKPRDISNISPRPILKSKGQNGFSSRSESPRIVTFKAVTANDIVESDVVKLYSDTDDIAEDTIKLPTMANSQQPVQPLEPVAPPVPPLHRLKEPLKDERSRPPTVPAPYLETHVPSLSSVSYIPPPPSSKPPSPPSQSPPSSPPRLPAHQQIPPPPLNPPPSVNEDEMQRPPLPVPYDICKKRSLMAKSKSSSKSNEAPPTDPPPLPPSYPPPPPSTRPPPLNPLKLTSSGSNTDRTSTDLPPPSNNAKDPLSPSIPNFKPPPPPVSNERKTEAKSQRGLPPPASRTTGSPPPPPPPSRRRDVVQDKMAPPPPPKRVESIQSSASHVKHALKNIANSVETNRSTPNASTTIELNAEFDSVNGENKSQFKNVHEKLIKSPNGVTQPLGDVQIVPPPVSSLRKGSDREAVNGVTAGSKKPIVPEKPKLAEPMSMYMVKVLPTSPPLITREDEMSGNKLEDSKVHSTSWKGSERQAKISFDSNELESRSIRTDSVSSVSSVSFPPLPPESLLSRVDEDSDIEFDGSQVIFHF